MSPSASSTPGSLSIQSCTGFDPNIDADNSIYRFYGKSIDTAFPENNEHMISDPIAATGSMGFPLSKEKGRSLATLRQDYQPGGNCVMNGSYCDSEFVPPTVRQWLRRNVIDPVFDAAVAGAVDYLQGNDYSRLFALLRLGALAARLSSDPGTQAFGLAARSIVGPGVGSLTASAQPTDSPSWIVTEVTTAENVNNLRFNWRFAEGGDGVLQVFVNDIRVRMLEQRFVPNASYRTESLWIGDLPSGRHTIAFRLDGFGANPSGVELTDVELGLVERVEVQVGAHILNVETYGPGSVVSAPAGINCGANCSAAFANGEIVALTAVPANGAHFTGWSGDCARAGICDLQMDADKEVTAVFAEGAPSDKSFTGPTRTGSGTFTATVQGGGSGCAFDLAQTGATALPAAPPSDIQFPNGVFQFRLVGCDAGSTVTLRVRWPEPASGQYWKYNPLTSQWYQYPGATFDPLTSTWTFQITDNGPHDADSAPGVIVDPTGPAQVRGGGLPPPIPILPLWGLLMLGIGTLILGLGALRSVSQR